MISVGKNRPVNTVDGSVLRLEVGDTTNHKSANNSLHEAQRSEEEAIEV